MLAVSDVAPSKSRGLTYAAVPPYFRREAANGSAVCCGAAGSGSRIPRR